ncbi:RPA3 (predicted) [Pycnogonum litorale]
MDNCVKSRINGSMMSDFHGKLVCLLGQVAGVDPNGMSFKLRACDGQIVTVQTSQAIQDNLEGMIEVVGTVTPRNTVMCTSYSAIPEEMTRDFDKASYNEAVQLLGRHDSKYI